MSSEIEQLRTLLYTDDLTGLYNRRFFRHCIAEQKTQSETTGIPFGFLMMDIDHFKQINDTYGHAVGDTTLMKVAKTLKEELREKGWVFRYAGDEFVALVRNASEDQLRTICTNLLSRVASIPVQEDPASPLKQISISIGFALYPNDTNSISELLEVSDRALYASKRQGRNSFQCAREILEREREQSGHWPIQVQCKPLIGRQNQWNILQHHFAECRNGHGRLLFIAGEAGIGKSRLIRHFIRRQRVGDYHILFGECTEGTIIHSYAPVRDSLRKGFEAKDPATVNVYKDLNQQHRSELIALVPQFDRFEKTPLHPPKSPDRYLLLESIFLLLQGLSKQLPTVMILEDIHWSDEATLNLLQYLARNVRNERILLIATFREEEAVHSTIPAIMQTMSRENLFERIILKPLTPEETALMTEEIFRGYVTTDLFKSWLYDETEGIPFYIEELIKLLLEEGYLQRDHQNIVLQRPDKFVLPYTIRTLIQRRTSRLDDAAKKILGYASIIGYEFDLNILMKLMGENEGYLLDLLEQLTKLQLIRELSSGGEERFAFRHNKIRDVIYEEMGAIKRRKYHQRVGEILESLHAEEIQLYAEDLAYHFERGGEIVKACTYALEAGKKAFKIHAYQDALTHFDRCLQYKDLHQEMTDGGPAQQLQELYTHHGQVLEALGRWEEAIQSYEQLFSLRNTSSFVEVDALNHLSRVFYKRENFSKSLMLAEQALEAAKEKNYAVGICNSYDNLGKNHWRVCNYEKALQYVQAAIELADHLNSPELRGKFLNTAGIVLLEQSRYEEALRHFQSAFQLFEQQSDKPGIIECLVNISIIRHLQGNLVEARQHIINAYALAQEIGDPFSIAACSVNQAELEYKLANYEIGSRLNERAGQIYKELDHGPGMTYYYENEAHLKMVTGQTDAAMEAIAKARSIAEEKNLKKRTIELLKHEASIRYFQGYYIDTSANLEKMAEFCRSIRDVLGEAEATLKRGFLYLAMRDIQEAAAQWSIVTKTAAPSADLLFWNTAATAFLASFQKKELDMLAAQQEMRIIAEKTEYAYMITAASLLSCYQFEILGQLNTALKFAEEAERRATSYHQDVWLTRIRMKLFELQKELRQPPSVKKVYKLLESAKQQNQNHVIYRCYRLLWEIDPQFENVQNEWKKHWESWQKQIPEQHRSSFLPAFEEY